MISRTIARDHSRDSGCSDETVKTSMKPERKQASSMQPKAREVHISEAQHTSAAIASASIKSPRATDAPHEKQSQGTETKEETQREAVTPLQPSKRQRVMSPPSQRHRNTAESVRSAAERWLKNTKSALKQQPMGTHRHAKAITALLAGLRKAQNPQPSKEGGATLTYSDLLHER